MRHVVHLQIGPARFRVGSAWRGPMQSLSRLYAGYPGVEGACDFTVRLEPDGAWRKYVRPSIAVRGDHVLPGAAPLALRHGLLAAEMGMNLQMALGERRFLLLHASTVEREGRAILMTGESGAGKSTLAALLGERGWRLMGDEFALLQPDTGLLHPFPRAVSLKNESIAIVEAFVGPERWGPVLADTPKGTIRHFRPNADAIARMMEPARPSLILFPRFGADLPSAIREVGTAEAFVRLTQASTNYVNLGETGFRTLTDLVTHVPALAVDYASTEAAIELVTQLASETLQ
jgi:HprK-related kinase A